MDNFSIIDYLQNNFNTILDHLGTFAFAISGIRLASSKKFDIFGAFVVGFITAIGGGTVRDLLIGVTPFWMINSSYLIVTGIALIAYLFFRKLIERMNITIFIFDAIGLGLFTVIGIEKSLDANFSYWVAIIMGMITGSVGGIIRDIAINEVPLIFRRDFYAIACIIGGVIYLICDKIGLTSPVTSSITAATVILLRVVANKYHIQLPTVKE